MRALAATRQRRAAAVGAAMAVLAQVCPATALTHGWDCVSCEHNSMLVSNFGTWRADLNLSDPWWVRVTADSHAAVILNNWWNRDYNGTGTDSKVAVARVLKAHNPNVRVYFYQPADRLGDTVYVQSALHAHPEWWLRDDNGNLIPFGGPGGMNPQIDPTVPGAQDFFANLSVSLFHVPGEAARLLDGVMVDGTSWTGASRYGPNVSAARYAKLFAGKMQMLAKMQRILTDLNGGEVWGNPLMEYGQITPNPTNGSMPPGAYWNTTLQYYDGAFDEMFGSFGTMDAADGAWDVDKMRWSFDTIANASAQGKTVVIHAFPGPAGSTHDPGGMFPTRPVQPGGPGGATAPARSSRLWTELEPPSDLGRRGKDASSENVFHVAAWAGPVPVPKSADACREAAATRLVESLAPFLIVATERVFFGYGWFYNMEDGYIPCPEGVECGMPSTWFPEFSKPIGAPLGPATTDATRTVWRRSFAHADVFVNLRNRSASRIDWA